MAPIDPQLLLLALIVFGAATVQVTAGFGSTIIALTLGTLLVPLHDLLPSLIVISLLTTFWILARDGGAVDLRLLGLRILPTMGLGTAVGVLVAQRLQGPLLEQVFGALVVGLSAWELAAMRRPEKTANALSRTTEAGVLVGSGVIHGLYGTGGPLLVYALDRVGLDKKTFRGTASAVWCVLNGVLIITFVNAGRLGPATLQRFWPLVVSLIPALWVGERLHGALSPRRFRTVIYVVLLFAGLTLLR